MTDSAELKKLVKQLQSATTDEVIIFRLCRLSVYFLFRLFGADLSHFVWSLGNKKYFAHPSGRFSS